jgi:uncharacterized protein
MSGSLPDRIDPLRLAETGRVLRGRLPLAALQRLAPSLYAVEGVVDVELDGFKEGRTSSLHGHIVTTLSMVCQRCLEPVMLPVDVHFRLGLVSSEEQAERLPEDLEPLLITEPTVRLADLIDDELILALPIVVLHPEGSECAVRAVMTAQAEPEPKPQDEAPRKNPFAVLSKLKNSH